jgi:DNA-binding Lrp family transcriptional regulator
VSLESPSWTFLTNHGHVLVCIAINPEVRISEIADQVGIGERATQGIVTDLVEGGYVTRTRVGRRNHYAVNPDLPLRHPLERDHVVGELLRAVASPPGDDR